MRLPRCGKALRIVLFVGLAGSSPLCAQDTPAPAQGQFCATYNDDATPQDCSFTSFAMCQAAISGLGGSCQPASSAPAALPSPLFHLHFGGPPDPATVPPPPIALQPPPPPFADPAAAPLLPGAPPEGY